MPEINVLKILTGFLERAANNDDDEAWNELVHNGRDNKDLGPYLAELRALFHPLQLTLGETIDVRRDEIVPFPNAPKRHFVQVSARLSIRGRQRDDWKGIAPTGRPVEVEPQNVQFIIVDGQISGFSAPLKQEDALETALRAERESFEEDEAARIEQQKEDEAALRRASRAAIRVALRDKKD